ncbi:MAG: alpha/beta fold hydrolase [Candidatus Micrarchaeia archaeon]
MDYNEDFENGYTATRNGNIYYMHHPGTSESILFLHGLGASTMVWQRLVKFIDEKFDVYLIDLLGHGNSDAPRIDYTVDALCDSVYDVINNFGIAAPYIFGHSYGGLVAAQTEYKYRLTKGLILEDAAGLEENFGRIEKNDKQERYKETVLKEAMKLNSNKDYVLRSILDSYFGSAKLTGDLLGEISKPTLLIWGSDDRIISIDYANTLSKLIKNSTLHIVKGAGHDPHFTHPEEVASELEAFIAANDTADKTGATR